MSREEDDEERQALALAQDKFYGTGDEFLPIKANRNHEFPMSFMLLVLLVPWGLFVAVYAAMSFSTSIIIHQGLTWFIFALGVLLVIASPTIPTAHVLGWHDPLWHLVITGMMLVALVLSTAYGSFNYSQNRQEYERVLTMQTYKQVNPESVSGGFYSDVGQVDFVKGVAPDSGLVMPFRNQHTYCVAPITAGSAARSTPVSRDPNAVPIPGNAPTGKEYRFWAVGVDCCASTGHAGNFNCGEHGETGMHMGLRALNQEHVGYYRLAVQKAESTYGISAPDPMFFYWVEDSAATLDSWRSRCHRFFEIGVWAHLGLQAFLTAAAWIWLRPRST